MYRKQFQVGQMIMHGLLFEICFISRINIRFVTRPDLIVIISSRAIYFAKKQLQLNNIANGIVKSKRKYSLPTKIGAKQAPKTIKKLDITMYLF